jgi:hypothetical protein
MYVLIYVRRQISEKLSREGSKQLEHLVLEICVRF